MVMALSGKDKVSILQSLYFQNEGANIKLCAAKEFTSYLFSKIDRPFSEDYFDQTFGTTHVTPLGYIKYLINVLVDPNNVNNSVDLEQICWNTCYRNYVTADLSYENTSYLWSVFIRLASEESFPPTIVKTNVNFLMLVLNLKFKKNTLKSLTFTSFLKRVTTIYKHVDTSCITKLHRLVVENNMARMLRVRCRANILLSTFDWYWCAIEGNCINYFKLEASCTRPEGTLDITNCIKIKRCHDKSLGAHVLSLQTEWGSVFQFMSYEDISSWANIVQNVINHKCSNGNKNRHRIIPPGMSSTRDSNDVLETASNKVKLPQVNVNKGEHEHPTIIPLQTSLPKLSRSTGDLRAVTRDFAETTLNTRIEVNKWDQFISLRRVNKSGESVMTSRTRMIADILPGQYNLSDIMPVRDLPPLIPKYTEVRGVKWMSKSSKESGKFIFPSTFDENISSEIATSEYLSYYGCTFAENSMHRLTLPIRHGIQDFTYKEGYLDEYVIKNSQGAGLEKHDFTHLDCPLEENSGLIVIGELFDDYTIHLTAFKIPPRHTLYIPAGCIHSNDYLRGTWRTMLSNEADIDHVLLVKQSKSSSEFQKFHFKFN